jgi:hypothetical protein
MSPLAVEAIRATGLDKFYDLNQDEFAKLVGVVYVGFLYRTADLRSERPALETLFGMFQAEIYMVMTAASPQRESLGFERPETRDVIDGNGMAREFLWNHLRREGVVTWQDFYAEGKKTNPRVKGLVNDFVHYVIARAFADGAATTYITSESNLREARRVVEDINRGRRNLRSV